MTSQISRLLVFAAALLAASLIASPDLAAEPGKGGGKPPKDEEPPPLPDAAIVYELWDNGRQIAVANADGSNQTVILAIPGVVHNTPSWAWDGDSVLFASDFNGIGVYSLAVDRFTPAALGDPEIVVPTNSAFPGVIRPMASPGPISTCGYDAIAYSDRPLNDDGSLSTEYELYLAVPDGAGYTSVRLTETPNRSEIFPSWSPDAGRLAYQHCVGSVIERSCDVLVSDIGCDTSSTPILTSEESLVLDVAGSPLDVPGAGFTGVSWSNTAVENSIALKVGMPSDANPDIWIIPVDDPFTAFNLTDNPDVLHVQPSWSPDDMQLIFRKSGRDFCGQKGKKGETSVSVRNLDGPLIGGCEEKAVIKTGGNQNLTSPHWWPNHLP